jgi:RhtB (resistance to homoserine/threonine) family protein
MNELIAVATITVLAVISPGADFAIVSRNSLSVSRRIGFYTALGISFGVLIHVTYSMLGIGMIISRSIILFNIIKFAGAIYLVFLGIKMILTKKQVSQEEEIVLEYQPGRAVRTGFFTNVLNPKTTLFILSLFTQVINPETPALTQMGYGVFISLAHLSWFSLVALFFSSEVLREKIHNIRHLVERSIGGVLCLLGVGLVRSSLVP